MSGSLRASLEAPGTARLFLAPCSPWLPRSQELFHPPGTAVAGRGALRFLQRAPGPRRPLVPGAKRCNLGLRHGSTWQRPNPHRELGELGAKQRGTHARGELPPPRSPLPLSGDGGSPKGCPTCPHHHPGSPHLSGAVSEPAWPPAASPPCRAAAGPRRTPARPPHRRSGAGSGGTKRGGHRHRPPALGWETTHAHTPAAFPLGGGQHSHSLQAIHETPEIRSHGKGCGFPGGDKLIRTTSLGHGQDPGHVVVTRRSCLTPQPPPTRAAQAAPVAPAAAPARAGDGDGEVVGAQFAPRLPEQLLVLRARKRVHERGRGSTCAGRARGRDVHGQLCE